MGKNSSRRFYRNYNEAGIVTSAFLPIDTASPGVFPLVTGDTAPAGIKTRATYSQPSLFSYPEITAVTNARKSVSAAGAPLGLLLEANKINYIYGAVDFATSGQAINWNSSGITGAGVLNETGPDGLTSAVTLTSTTTNASLTLARGAIAAGTRRFTVWLKRKTGSGTVLIRVTTTVTLDVTASLSSTEWRRFEVTAASGQVTCGIQIGSLGDSVCAYGPGLYVSANGRSSTSLPQSQISSPFVDYLDFTFPLTTPRPIAGATVLIRIDTRVRETGIFSTSTSSWVNGQEYTVAGNLYGQDSDVTAGFGIDSVTGQCSISFNDYVNTAESLVELALGSPPPIVSCALSMMNGKARVISDAGMDPILFDDPNFVFDDPNYGSGDPPGFGGSISAGACYVRSFAVWPFFSDTDQLYSLLNNFK